MAGDRLRRPILYQVLLAAAGVLALPAAAGAHLVNTGLGPFYDGISHLALTPEDLLPAIALALLAGLRGPRPGRLTLFALPGAWLAGGLAGLVLPTAGTGSVAATVSFIAIGGLVALDAHLKPSWVAALALALGLLHGYLNGSAMAEAKLGLLGLAGIIAALFVVVSLVAAFVVGLRASWARIAVRVAGSWIVAIGLLLLGWSLRAV
jgi:urease accessory protein